MSVEYTEEMIAYYMIHDKIGIVSYVDFTSINQKPGFGENVDEVVKSAFVHFSATNLSNHDFWHTIATGQPYKLKIKSDEYWLCLKNNNPIQRTLMNLHQVVENGRHLEGLIESQAKIIQEQANKLEELERKLEGTHDVVYSLLGGLFHQEEQTGILSLHMDNLFCRETSSNTKLKYLSKWGIWPTTRQGDECEKKIAELEDKFQKFKSKDD